MKGTYGKVIKHKSKKVWLKFKKEVSVESGKVYRTNLKGVSFKVKKISNGATKVYGFINKKLKKYHPVYL